MGIKLKKTVAVVVLLIATATSFAQGYTISPDDTAICATDLGELKVSTITQVRTGTDTLYLAWQKVEVSMPGTWEASLCDYENCYTTLPDFGYMTPVRPGDDGFLSLHITPIDTIGTAVIRYAVWDLANPSQRDTLTWLVHSTTTSAGSIANNTPFIFSGQKNIFINNSGQSFTHLTVCDLNGKTVLDQAINRGQQTIDMSFVNDGIYIAVLTGDEKYKRQKLFISN